MATQAEITQIYQTVLGRAPDPQGLAFWESSGQTPQQIAQSLATSPEGQIRAVYQTTLGRAPDAEGQAFWQGRLGQPGGLLGVTADIANTPEAMQRQTVSGLYQSILGRAPDVAGQEFWEKELASGKSINDVKEAIRQSSENTIPNRPTFDDVFSRWNEEHREKFGKYYNIAILKPEQIQTQIDELIIDTKAEQAKWDEKYGNTQEGRIISQVPPPNWYDVYARYDEQHRAAFGRPINRSWNSDDDARKAKDALDQMYLTELSNYNQRFGTNIQPDVGVLGVTAQPNAYYKEPDAPKKAWYQQAAPYLGAALAIAFPGAGTALGSALGLGSGLTSAIAGNALIGGALSGAAGGNILTGAALGGLGATGGALGEALLGPGIGGAMTGNALIGATAAGVTGQNIAAGALLGGAGGALSQVNWGSIADTLSDITGISADQIRSTLSSFSQPSSDIDLASQDAFRMAQNGLGTAAIQQNLIASGLDSLTAATLANNAVMPGANAANLAASVAGQPGYTNVAGMLSGGNAFATTQGVFDDLVRNGATREQAVQLINQAGGGLNLGQVGLDASGNLVAASVGGAGSLLGGALSGGAGAAGTAAGGAAAGGAASAAGRLAGGLAGQLGAGLLGGAAGIGGAMADRAALERYAQRLKDAANQYILISCVF